MAVATNAVRRDADLVLAALDRVAGRRRALPAPQVLVRGPGLELEFGSVTQPFHVASVGKLMTAVLIARLVERRLLEFVTPVGRLLPARELDGLPAATGVDIRNDVTVEHLLTHTSGLPDFFEPQRGHHTNASIRAIVNEPERRWTPSDLLAEARALPAVGYPGERFHYADTGYVLLGRIAEEVAGVTLSDLLRIQVYEPSGMEQTSTPYSDAQTIDDVLSLDVAPFWIGRHELTRALAVSLDWAGGGQVAPAEDLVRFQRALHGGRLISADHLTRLIRPRRRLRRGIHYGAGSMTLKFAEFGPWWRALPEPVGHLGVWATHLFYYPRQDAHVVLNFHSTREMSRSFRVHASIARLIGSLGRP